MKHNDEAAGVVTFRHTRSNVVTAAIERLEFHHPCPISEFGKKPELSRQRGGAQEFVPASIFPNKDYRLKSTMQVWYVPPSTVSSMPQFGEKRCDYVEKVEKMVSDCSHYHAGQSDSHSSGS